MTPPTTCLRCGSDSVIPDVRPVDRDNNDTSKAQQLALARTPGALMFKGTEFVAMTAQVCADCGFVELHAVDPEALWQAHLERVANGWTA